MHVLLALSLLLSFSHSVAARAGLNRRAVTVPPSSQLPSGWNYTGCYTDNANRAMNVQSYSSNSMTDESCISFCSGYGLNYAGTEYSGECFCANQILSSLNPDTDCNMACSGNSSEACGGPYRLSVFWNGKSSSTGPVVNPGIAPYNYVGCYNDSAAARTLANQGSVPGGINNGTVASCLSVCGAQGYTIAGVEYGGECWCDNALANGGSLASDGASGCAMPCHGNASEFCGGSNRLTLYTTLGWQSSGCYNDSTQARTLPAGLTGNLAPNMTRELCQTQCQNAGYGIAGVEYSGECFCGNSWQNGGASASDGYAQCTMTCNGNHAETCGGPNRLNAFTYKGAMPVVSSTMASSMAASSVSPTSTSLTSSASVTTSQSNSLPIATSTSNAPSSASSSIPASSSILASTTAIAVTTSLSSVISTSSSAFTTTSTQSISTATSITSISSTTFVSSPYSSSSGSSANSSTILGTATPATTSVSASDVSKSTSSVAPTPTGPVLPANWSYQGCWIDNANGRIFTGKEIDNNTMTVESCASQCANLGYSIGGVEYSTQCFCDNFARNGGALAGADSQCNMPCGGNSSEMCGAGNRLSVYSNSSIKAYAAPKPQSTNLTGSWTYQGCLDDSGTRSLSYQIVLTNNNTANNCIAQCSAFGYMSAGLEYGDECYCGDASDVASRSFTPASDCSFACSGDPTQICGGPGRLSYYTWTGTPLYQWNYASGSNAGAYQFLIGGVVVPLITIPGKNGKVTFVEKSGTGPPNSTGAYELDLAQINNFTAAWRPMHVKTDVFCSSGLTLPDKAARQINIGGWSDDSTFGVRLYTPDGSPGVWGVNDWQENVHEVALKNGRWYPTSMIMANGSILVVGGEAGSNGAAVPTLELLPAPAGGYVKFCDYLNRTDPLNLYPFLAVLPSKNVLITYYNEARILDQNTLDTIATLPNIPGAVNRPDGGRTYPLEGTSVILPQYAPYSAPLSMLVCGGSTPYQGFALDNCASIAPEVANPQWNIERMPSKRVISCMTALPDGTFLIINGAQQGQAGFGLASNPNLNALLYDPSLPLGQRMTVMANTTIARLYHSEAVLLDDGRVLVSGSDPEDNTHPQEYRVEVFVPPYLLTGAQQPSFSLANTDWAYGQTYTVTLGALGATSTVASSAVPASATVVTAMAGTPAATTPGTAKDAAASSIADSTNASGATGVVTANSASASNASASTYVAATGSTTTLSTSTATVTSSSSINPSSATSSSSSSSSTALATHAKRAGSSSSSGISVSLLGAVSSTHGNSMGQRTLFPAVSCSSATYGSGVVCTITAPPHAGVCPPGWFQLFVLNGGVPSHATWVRVGGDPAQLGNWPAFADFTTPGV